MPTRPSVKTIEATAPQILNAIRNEAPQSYRDYVPYADGTLESLRSIGNIIMQYQPLQNDFLKALVNRIGRVLITSKMYSNPWADFKKGLLEYGEIVEEVFVNLANPHQFNPEVAETDVFKREIPDVRAAFHIMNYQKFYKTTISNDQLRQAFLSWEGISDLISKIIDALYTGANYDEFITMKYLIARMALNGNIHPQNIPTVNADNAHTIVSNIKGISNQLEFLSTAYNMAGVASYTNKNDQYLILNATFDAVIDVEVLASAFNMDKAQFMGRRVLVDSFANQDVERLNILFANDSAYVPFTQEELTLLETIPAVLLDRNWFMIFDNFYNFTEQYNGEGLYWNYWYHVWKTFSASPFANAILFTTQTPAVTSVTVTPATATVNKGSSLQMSASVVTTGFAPKNVTWALTGAADAGTTISSTGLLTVNPNETAATLNVTATSIYDSAKVGTATITVNA